MPDFYRPDLGLDPNNPFARDQDSELVRRSYWLDMIDSSIVLALTKGVGANLSNEEKRAHLADIKREHLIDEIIIQEILPPNQD
ncbi:MAG: hypothetical protein VX430_00165 [Pseudomonadota bacterium]|nr:hypothetical protein [Pseudomonadota bacterium]